MLPVDLLILDLVVILATAQVLGAAARRIGQPVVIGQILAGILLGPTLLGRLVGQRLFPATVVSPLTALADVGLVLFMVMIGMELDQRMVRSKGEAAIGVAVGATLVPFGLGAGFAVWLAHAHAHGRPLPFVLFLGTAVSATAFPVLARILTDRGMQRTPLGAMAMASAALIDVSAWLMLAVVAGLAGASGHSSWRIWLTAAYVLVMLFVIRPLLRRLVPAFERAGRITPALLSAWLIGLLASAWATQWMGIHFVFGAFLYGIMMPRSDALIKEILTHLEQLAVLFLLPIFFVVTGLTVNLGTLRAGALGTLAAILAISVVGKLAGGYAGARLSGFPPRTSAALAALLNTRGLTEIVILTVGLQEHVLDMELYSMMIIMALVTTAMTGPLLNLCYPRGRAAEDLADAGQLATGADEALQTDPVH
jgi:Kef-type K+ transport system membrane component KefB